MVGRLARRPEAFVTMVTIGELHGLRHHGRRLAASLGDVNEAEGPARGGAEQDDDADPAPRSRPTANGARLWIGAGAVLLTQAAIVILIAGRWRTLGGVLVAVATLAAVAAATMPAGGRGRTRARGNRPERRRR
jgi:hypothetical protein